VNLGRAKLILIIAFAALNFFLGYQLFWPDFGRLTRVAVSVDELQSMEKMLKDNNYVLQASINRAFQTRDFITVSPSLAVQRLILLRFLREGAQIFQGESVNYYYIEGETAEIHRSGLIRILYNPALSLGKDLYTMEQRELRNLIDQFLVANQLNLEGLSFDYLEKVDPASLIALYYQVIAEDPVYTGQLKVFSDADQIRMVEIYWLETVERFPAKEIQVISAVEALGNLIFEIGPASETAVISRVELGYYSGEYEAEKWEMPPVWRIIVNGQPYYINAFTGNLEKEVIIPEQLQ
jgi:regulatory protein YycI of two-component signal transduction system YycFG